ncbi:alpha/beta hydrolase [Pseudomonas sp.]|uniref:alpha/beta fold hydrolase n=1 Tax=Pseudomonas sp. TaxID=306 RepID=UPI00257B6ADC|nr:alpha/beta hydrolase [Pseudomonas sp.]
MTDLVLLHGGKHGSWCWAPFIAAMEQHPGKFEWILTLNMPECGQKRVRDVAALQLSDVVAELNQDLHELGVSQTVLLGHSIAGAVKPMIVAAAPDL